MFVRGQRRVVGTTLSKQHLKQVPKGQELRKQQLLRANRSGIEVPVRKLATETVRKDCRREPNFSVVKTYVPTAQLERCAVANDGIPAAIRSTVFRHTSCNK